MKSVCPVSFAMALRALPTGLRKSLLLSSLFFSSSSANIMLISLVHLRASHGSSWELETFRSPRNQLSCNDVSVERHFWITSWLFADQNCLPQEFQKCQKVSFWKRWDSNLTIHWGYLVDVSDTVPLPDFFLLSPFGSIRWHKAKVVPKSDQIFQSANWGVRLLLIWLVISVLNL